ncbi:protein ndnf [Plakobranchus ocellatus]|uniref:Protein NDNF n=1 Tax=Plakobranchus ocellatus TaxID=259542 RepID=A0AAV4DU56_9GAST|nr:protein ndnf [Plakobranchus ocellatus]
MKFISSTLKMGLILKGKAQHLGNGDEAKPISSWRCGSTYRAWRLSDYIEALASVAHDRKFLVDLWAGSIAIEPPTLYKCETERQWTMPMSKNFIEQQQQQQGTRVALPSLAVPLPFSLNLVHLLSLSLLVVLAPCPCPGLQRWPSTRPGEDHWKNLSSPRNYTTLQLHSLQRVALTEEKGTHFSLDIVDIHRKGLTKPNPLQRSDTSRLTRNIRAARDFWSKGQNLNQKLSTFADSHILVLDTEQERYIYRQKSKSFFFTIKNPTQLEVVLTPCSSRISWSFTRVSDDDYLSKQRPLQDSLFSYSGEDRRCFSEQVTAGRYEIQVKSLNSKFDSRVFIFLGTESEYAASSALLYPPLPKDPVVRAKAKFSRNTGKAIVQWQPAAPSFHGLRLEYCVVINRMRNFHTHCAALAFVEGVRKPKKVSWGGSAAFNRKKQKGSAKPVKAQSQKNIMYKCVGNKTSFTYTEGAGALKLRPGKRYFIDVFVKDLDKATSSAYKGISTRIKKKYRHWMKIGESRSFKLRPRRRPKIMIVHNQTFHNLTLDITSCQGQIPVRIYRNNKKIKDEIISRFNHIVIPNKPPGRFAVTFPTKRPKTKRETLLSSTKKAQSSNKRQNKVKKSGTTFVTISLPSQSSPIEALPQDLSLSVLHYLSGCRNVTLEWRAAGQSYTYCVYYKRVGKNAQSIKELRDICRGANDQPRHTNLAGCISHHVSHPNKDTITYNVHDLDPGTCYRFDVLMTRKGMASIPYDGLRAKTPEYCEHTKAPTSKEFKCLRKRQKGDTRKYKQQNG